MYHEADYLEKKEKLWKNLSPSHRWYSYTCSIFVCGILHHFVWTYCKIRVVLLSLTLLNVMRKESARKKSCHEVSRSHFFFSRLYFLFTLDGLSEKGTTLSLAFLLLRCKQRLISIALELSKKSSFVSGLVCHDSGSQNKLMQILIFYALYLCNLVLSHLGKSSIVEAMGAELL